MFRIILGITAITLAVCAIPADLPEPSKLALQLNEDEFEDYLDYWLGIEEQKWVNTSMVTTATSRNGCAIRINGDLGQPQPVFLYRSSNTFIEATRNTGVVNLNPNEEIVVACTGTNRLILHPNILKNTQTEITRCVAGTSVSGAGWLNGAGAFGQLTCSSNPQYVAHETGERCFNNNIVIHAGFIIDNVFHPHFWSCFDPVRLEVLYVRYQQRSSNAIHQTGVTRPGWLVSTFFPGIGINNIYTQANQRVAFERMLGASMVDRYLSSTQFLARGHLAAKTDFVFASGQRSTFFFINAAPQWQPFNAGNWNWLEQNLRHRIGVAGFDTMVYTGTFGVTQLRNANGHFVDIYLEPNNRVPVPLYFYKVVYDASRRRGTAFISINNPYYTMAEALGLQFCTDRCRNNPAFDWLRWQPDRVEIGYSFCCTVDDFRNRVPHLPHMDVSGGLLS